MAPHSSTLGWKIPWMEEPGGAAVHGVTKSRTRLSDVTFTFHFPLSCIGEGNGNPLQCSCLENPRDRGAWWAAVYGVTQSQTWLKRLSSSRECIQRDKYEQLHNSWYLFLCLWVHCCIPGALKSPELCVHWQCGVWSIQ